MQRDLCSNYNRGEPWIQCDCTPHEPYLFLQLMNNRTVKFVESFMILMLLFLVKYGLQNLVDSVNAVQPGLFIMIMDQIWIPNLKLITGSIEAKLT